MVKENNVPTLSVPEHELDTKQSAPAEVQKIETQSASEVVPKLEIESVTDVEQKSEKMEKDFKIKEKLSLSAEKVKSFWKSIDFKKLALSVAHKLAGFLVLIGVFIVWEAASKAINMELFLPSPARTFEAMRDLYLTGNLFNHLGATFGRVTMAILITAAISIPLGMAIVWCKPVNVILGPIVRSLRYVPTNIFSPLLVMFLGIDETMKITFLVIATFFAYLPVVTQTCSEIDVKYKETAYTMGFGYFRTIVFVLFPYVLPSLVKSLITTYGTGWNGVILAEVNNTKYGLAHLVYIGTARGRTASVYAAIVIIIAVNFVFDKIANYAVKKIFKWRYVKDE